MPVTKMKCQHTFRGIDMRCTMYRLTCAAFGPFYLMPIQLLGMDDKSVIYMMVTYIGEFSGGGRRLFIVVFRQFLLIPLM